MAHTLFFAAALLASCLLVAVGPTRGNTFAAKRQESADTVIESFLRAALQRRNLVAGNSGRSGSTQGLQGYQVGTSSTRHITGKVFSAELASSSAKSASSSELSSAPEPWPPWPQSGQATDLATWQAGTRDVDSAASVQPTAAEPPLIFSPEAFSSPPPAAKAGNGPTGGPVSVFPGPDNSVGGAQAPGASGGPAAAGAPGGSGGPTAGAGPSGTGPTGAGPTGASAPGAGSGSPGAAPPGSTGGGPTGSGPTVSGPTDSGSPGSGPTGAGPPGTAAPGAGPTAGGAPSPGGTSAGPAAGPSTAPPPGAGGGGPAAPPESGTPNGAPPVAPPGGGTAGPVAGAPGPGGSIGGPTATPAGEGIPSTAPVPEMISGVPSSAPSPGSYGGGGVPKPNAVPLAGLPAPSPPSLLPPPSTPSPPSVQSDWWDQGYHLKNGTLVCSRCTEQRQKVYGFGPGCAAQDLTVTIRRQNLETQSRRQQKHEGTGGRLPTWGERKLGEEVEQLTVLKALRSASTPPATNSCPKTKKKLLVDQVLSALMKANFTRTAQYLKKSFLLMSLTRRATILVPSDRAFDKDRLPPSVYQRLHSKTSLVRRRARRFLMRYHTIYGGFSYHSLLSHAPLQYPVRLNQTNGTGCIDCPINPECTKKRSRLQSVAFCHGNKQYLVFGSLPVTKNIAAWTWVNKPNLFCNNLVRIHGVSRVLIPPKFFPPLTSSLKLPPGPPPSVQDGLDVSARTSTQPSPASQIQDGVEKIEL